MERDNHDPSSLTLLDSYTLFLSLLLFSLLHTHYLSSSTSLPSFNPFLFSPSSICFLFISRRYRTYSVSLSLSSSFLTLFIARHHKCFLPFSAFLLLTHILNFPHLSLSRGQPIAMSKGFQIPFRNDN